MSYHPTSILCNPYLTFSKAHIFKSRSELLQSSQVKLKTAVQRGTGGVKVAAKQVQCNGTACRQNAFSFAFVISIVIISCKPGSEECLLIRKKALQSKLGQASRARKEIKWLLSSQSEKRNLSKQGFQDSSTAYLQPEMRGKVKIKIAPGWKQPKKAQKHLLNFKDT